MKWEKFFKDLGQDQLLPPTKKAVLVRCVSNVKHYPDPVVVGYLKFAAGDKDCPYFVTPGANAGEPYLWCDCLPDAPVSDFYQNP